MYRGHDLEGGFGPFEMIDMANAAGIDPVMTTFAVGVAPEEMGDLVEYCYGSADTAWGRVRIVEDRHPAPYEVKFIELGAPVLPAPLPRQYYAACLRLCSRMLWFVVRE